MPGSTTCPVRPTACRSRGWRRRRPRWRKRSKTIARIVFADAGIPFDGLTPKEGPLGGAETACIGLLEALAARGHTVSGHTNTRRRVSEAGVDWQPLDAGLPETADLYIANRGHRLITAMPAAKRTAFWIHNPARYLLKARFLWPLLRVRPAIVFSGPYHAATYPRWAPAGERRIIPYGIAEPFISTPPATETPPPRAIFTSNPERGLDWLLSLWVRGIRPKVPNAELHLFVGSATYGGRNAARIAPVLAMATGLADQGVVLRKPVPKGELIEELRGARAMLYRGDPGETFCLALGEAQALGVPCIVQPIGCVAERIRHGETGYVEPDDDAFAAQSVALLTDDALWRRQQTAAVATQRSFGWPEAATAWESLIPRSA